MYGDQRMCYNPLPDSHGLSFSFFSSLIYPFLLLISVPCFVQTSTQTLKRSTLICFLYISLRVSYPSFPFASLRLTYLMPCFTYCSGSWTPDPSLIRLVVDRPYWTSLLYISRPVSVELGLKPDLVQSRIVLAVVFKE